MAGALLAVTLKKAKIRGNSTYFVCTPANAAPEWSRKPTKCIESFIDISLSSGIIVGVIVFDLGGLGG